MMLIITPVFMTGCILLLDLCKPLCKVMQFFGGLSTNMWLTHTFFCYYFYPFAIVIFWSRNPIVAYLTLLAITVLASVFLDKFYFSIEKLGVKLRKKIKGIKNR